VRNPLSRDIPKGAAAAIVALALVAGVVTGREPARPETLPVAAKEPATSLATPIDEIDLKRLSRLRSEREVPDLFAPPVTRTAAPAAPVAPAPIAVVEAPQPPPAPTAPPLPFSYLGRMTRGEDVVVYLLRGQDLLVAQAGSVLDDQYRVDGISDSAVQIQFVPLGIKQLLAIPAAQ
jgi:hypothetical protein